MQVWEAFCIIMTRLCDPCQRDDICRTIHKYKRNTTALVFNLTQIVDVGVIDKACAELAPVAKAFSMKRGKKKDAKQMTFPMKMRLNAP